MYNVISARIWTWHICITGTVCCQNMITVTKISQDHIRFLLMCHIKCIRSYLWDSYDVFCNRVEEFRLIMPRLSCLWIHSKIHENWYQHFLLGYVYIALLCLSELKLICKKFVACTVDWHPELIQEKHWRGRSEILKQKTLCENGHRAFLSR